MAKQAAPPFFGDAIICVLDNSALSLRDIGCLVSTSSGMKAAMDESSTWETTFKQAAAAGATCTIGDFSSYAARAHYKKISFNNEPGLLDCFRAPGAAVIESVGWRQATKCLLSKVCADCGMMAATANPLTLVRRCTGCAKEGKKDQLISKGKAKEAFLLSEKEVKALPTALMPKIPFFPSEILLVADVLAASDSKWGGADGLATAIETKTAAAVAKYTKSQSTDKPQKKRPKIEGLNARPSEHLAQVTGYSAEFLAALPICVALRDYRGARCFAFATKCDHCPAHGLVDDIVRHTRLCHGVCLRHDSHKQQPAPCDPPAGLETESISAESIMANAEATFTFVDETFDDADFGSLSAYEEHNASISCPIAPTVEYMRRFTVDYIMESMTQCEMGTLSICGQIGNEIPFELAVCGLGENRIGRNNGFEEAPTERFDAFALALGLRETSAAQLLAMLLCKAMPLSTYAERMEWNKPDASTSPVWSAAHALLLAAGAKKEDD